MTGLLPQGDRDSSVGLQADRLAAIVLSFGILVIVAWRAFVNAESSWDLLGLLVLSGVFATGYRLGRGATSTRLFSVMALAAIIAALVAIGLALVTQPR